MVTCDILQLSHSRLGNRKRFLDDFVECVVWVGVVLGRTLHFAVTLNKSWIGASRLHVEITFDVATVVSSHESTMAFVNVLVNRVRRYMKQKGRPVLLKKLVIRQCHWS